MKFFNLQQTKKSLAQIPVEEIKLDRHEEPQGYLHSNFRHWIWFKPSDHRAQ